MGKMVVTVVMERMEKKRVTRNMKKPVNAVIVLLFICAATIVEAQPGRDGRDGEDGRDGRDGEDGVPGPAGQDGKDGKDGRDGRDGKDGEKGEKGDPGLLGPPGPPGPSSGGVVYTRWGRTTCPDTPGTELVYAGRAGGTHFSLKGGAANYLCLPENPDYLSTTAGFQGFSPVYGAVYASGAGGGPLSSVHEQNVPCSVCCTTARGMVLMLPAKTQCPPSWTLEYSGYLMTQHKDQHRTVFECVDQDPEPTSGSVIAGSGVLFYHTEASCAGLPCPPYDSQKELTCAVCTK